VLLLSWKTVIVRKHPGKGGRGWAALQELTSEIRGRGEMESGAKRCKAGNWCGLSTSAVLCYVGKVASGNKGDGEGRRL
jgi:hypothetical protein